VRIDVTALLREPVGTQSRVEFDLGLERLSADVSVNAVRGRVKLLRTDEGVWVQGDLDVIVELECGRCLCQTQKTLKIELDERFLAQHDASANEQVSVMAPDHHIDLQPVLRDLVILSTPMHVLCEPDCKGLCVNCGKNLNEGPCDCETDSIDPRLAVLKALIQ